MKFSAVFFALFSIASFGYYYLWTTIPYIFGARVIEKNVFASKIVVLNEDPLFIGMLFPVYEAFLELGVPVEWKNSFDPNDNETIYITATVPFRSNQPRRYISYNWEVMASDRNFDEDIYARFGNAMEVWDYSLENVKFFQNRGINAKVILPGPNLLLGRGMVQQFPSIRDIDLVFIGALNERRVTLWNNIKTKRKFNS